MQVRGAIGETFTYDQVCNLFEGSNARHCEAALLPDSRLLTCGSNRSFLDSHWKDNKTAPRRLDARKNCTLWTLAFCFHLHFSPLFG